MRTRILTLLFVALSLTVTGCATGFRVGGDRYGAGIGGYIGAVPSAVAGRESYVLPPVSP